MHVSITLWWSAAAQMSEIQPSPNVNEEMKKKQRVGSWIDNVVRVNLVYDRCI